MADIRPTGGSTPAAEEHRATETLDGQPQQGIKVNVHIAVELGIAEQCVYAKEFVYRDYSSDTTVPMAAERELDANKKGIDGLFVSAYLPTLDNQDLSPEQARKETEQLTNLTWSWRAYLPVLRNPTVQWLEPSDTLSKLSAEHPQGKGLAGGNGRLTLCIVFSRKRESMPHRDVHTAEVQVALQQEQVDAANCQESERQAVLDGSGASADVALPIRAGTEVGAASRAADIDIAAAPNRPGGKQGRADEYEDWQEAYIRVEVGMRAVGLKGKTTRAASHPGSKQRQGTVSMDLFERHVLHYRSMHTSPILSLIQARQPPYCTTGCTNCKRTEHVNLLMHDRAIVDAYGQQPTPPWGSRHPAVLMAHFNSERQKYSASLESKLDVPGSEAAPTPGTRHRPAELTSFGSYVCPDTVQALKKAVDAVYLQQALGKALSACEHPQLRINNVRRASRASGTGPMLNHPRRMDTGKPCLVLDLDDTLVHTSGSYLSGADYVIPDGLGGNVTTPKYVCVRPGCDEFLAAVGQKYEVVVFTAALSDHADAMLDLIDRHNVIRARLYREACTIHDGDHVKDLSLLGRPPWSTIIIDDRPWAFKFQLENGLSCTSFRGDKGDKELYKLADFLTHVADTPDVREPVRLWKWGLWTKELCQPKSEGESLSPVSVGTVSEPAPKPEPVVTGPDEPLVAVSSQ